MAKQKHRALLQIIEKAALEEPYEYDGLTWARFTQPELAETAGFSLSTVERLIREPPIQRLSIKDLETGRKVTLLRVGEKVLTATDRARIMAKIAEKAGARVERAHYGMLRGLVNAWPADLQLAIFECAMRNWSDFMIGVDFEIEAMKARGEKAVKRFYKFPSIGVIRRFPAVALELYETELQASGELKKLTKLSPELVPLAEVA